ncbi:MAG: hypothetical protein ACRBF0_00425 [Calditrichia bacterium]
MRGFTNLFALALLLPLAAFGMRTTVVVQYGGEADLRAKVEVALNDVLNAANQYHETGSSLSRVTNHFSNGAFNDFTSLIHEAGVYANESEYTSFLLAKSDGSFEIRDLKVRLTKSSKNSVPYQYLVFTFNASGQITATKFTVKKQRYLEIIEQGRKLNDLAYREKILHFIELYRTAYNRKDSVFIERTLSDDALIIVGNVVKVQEQDSDFLQKSFLSDEQIRFLLLKKHDYLRRLSQAFRANEFVQINFDDIIINRHPRFNQIYGVQLKQRWNSSNYSDEGYLFLMMDFVQPEEPIVHVRAWQPEQFEDGSTVSIFDFDIIE